MSLSATGLNATSFSAFKCVLVRLNVMGLNVISFFAFNLVLTGKSLQCISNACQMSWQCVWHLKHLNKYIVLKYNFISDQSCFFDSFCSAFSNSFKKIIRLQVIRKERIRSYSEGQLRQQPMTIFLKFKHLSRVIRIVLMM